MRYLADILTFTRFILAIILVFLATAVESPDIGAGFLIFVIAELTDAFDGTLATKFPFPKDKTPKYRKYAAKYDMVADALTALAAALFFTLKVNFAAGLIILFSYGIASLIVDLVVYGRILGHPDNCTKNSLTKRNFPLAKKIVLARRFVYLSLIAIVSVWMLYVSNWPLVVKITISVIALFISVFLWFFLSQRRHNISRDAVNIEKKLAKSRKK